MGSAVLGENLGISEEVIKVACSAAIKAHKSAGKQLYVSKKIPNSSELLFSFPGSWSVSDWFSTSSFGETKVDVDKDVVLFPSLKYIGLGETASINEAFLRRFKAVLANPQFIKEVETAAREGKQIVFTGHSLGGPIAMLATIWFLENYIRLNRPGRPPFCITFGSPLLGDCIMGHAIRRENWSTYFINFVMRYDIVPRISLAPLSFLDCQLQQVLDFFNPKSPLYMKEHVIENPGFFVTVMRSAASVASHVACKIMGNTNLLLETLSNFIQLSPYRPFGTYIFCPKNGKLVVIRNPDAILQLLFYTCQLSSETELSDIACSSMNDHLNYKDEIQDCLDMRSVTYFDDHHLESLPLLSDGSRNAEISIALNDLGLSARARLCLRSAGELAKQKRSNQEAMDKKMVDIENGIEKLQGYKKRCECKAGYYDAFKISEEKEDFDANVRRLELAGIWDEIIEMLKRSELPDEFENRKKWIDVGTRYRRTVEPLDIANYYRHLKNEDTGPYLIRGRPKRYKCTQRWREHAEKISKEDPSTESCFWAEAEELIKASGPGVREQILELKGKVEKWIKNGDLDRDVLLTDSTYDKLLKELNPNGNVTFQSVALNRRSR